MLRLLFILLVVGNAEPKLSLSTEVVSMEVYGKQHFQLQVRVPTEGYKNVTFESSNNDSVKVIPKSLVVSSNNTARIFCFDLQLESLKAGKSAISITSELVPSINATNETVFLVVEMYKYSAVHYISKIMGWSYFVSWSISFYPQIYINYKRKSVIGLSFDFNWLNLYGYFIYNIFNMGMYFSPPVQEQFAVRNPRTINPVHLNDIVFSMHSLFLTVVIIVQSYCYDSGNQKTSKAAIVTMALYFLITYFFAIMAMSGAMSWLDVLYAFSYIKLSICITKCIPQMYLNYKRQSTGGYSMGSIGLDFVGGIFSILEMVLDSMNYADRNCIFGNPTKLGLGVFSIIFDVAFAIQHYFTWDHGCHIRQTSSDGSQPEAIAYDNHAVSIENETVGVANADVQITANTENMGNTGNGTDFEITAANDVCGEEMLNGTNVANTLNDGNDVDLNQETTC